MKGVKGGSAHPRGCGLWGLALLIGVDLQWTLPPGAEKEEKEREEKDVYTLVEGERGERGRFEPLGLVRREDQKSKTNR